MDDRLRREDMVFQQQQMDEVCNHLILSGVLYRRGRDYSFTSPVFVRVLQQTYDLQYLLKKVKEEGVA